MVQLLVFSSLLLLVSSVTYGATTDRCKRPLIRKEWRTLSKGEKWEYIKAVKCIQKQPSRLTNIPGAESRFEDYQGVHILAADFIHYVGHFMPWHRYMVATYERELRDLCEYEGAQPYWDWTLDVTTDDSIFSSPVFDPKTGFGGNGPYRKNPDPKPPSPVPGRTGGGCVPNGPFKNLTLNLGPLKNVTKNPHCLTRDISPLLMNRVLTAERVEYARSKKDFAHFDIEVQGGITFDTITYHGGGHLGIGGELGIMADIYASPGDPIFYLHHAQVDRLWWLWQKQNLKKRLRDIAGPDTQFAYPFDFKGPKPYKNITLEYPLKMGGLVEDVQISDVMDVKSGVLCYDYR
ncbi:Di-copper centre-containing protein [Wilcoxina mikolae CBS 423.85]|nr:Di-copper centre-containing protein [Wilcoxina mikolae CBS 423.85]